MSIRTRTSGIMINVNVEPASAPFAPSCTPSANFLSRATNITSSNDKQNYDNLICGLNSDGVLTKLDGLYAFVIDATTARLNLVQNAFNLTETATVTFSSQQGFTSNGTTGFEDTGFTPSTAGGQMTLNSGHISAFLNTAGAATAKTQIGATDGANNKIRFLLDATAGGSGGFTCNDNTAANDGSAGGHKHYIVTRTSSSALNLYFDGAASAGNPFASNSVALVTTSIFICAHNENGPADNFFTGAVGAASIGSALSSNDSLNLYSRVLTFMKAYGNSS